MLFAQAMAGSQEKGLHIGNQGVHPAQGTAVFIKDLVMVGISLTQRGTKGSEGIIVDLAARANSTLGSGIFCCCIQIGYLYFEKAGTPWSVRDTIASSSTFRADETVRPTLFKQIYLARFLRLESLPKLFEANPFLLAHPCRHPSLVRLSYHFFCPIARYYILRLVDLSR